MSTNIQDRIHARDSAMRMLNRLTAGVAFAAIGGVGLLSVVSASTVPGTAVSSTAATTSTPTTSAGTTSAGLQQSSTPVTSSSSSGVAVSGGS